MKDDGIPFRTVWDNSLVARKVMKIPNRITAVSSSAGTTEPRAPLAIPPKNIVNIAINAGNAQPF